MFENLIPILAGLAVLAVVALVGFVALFLRRVVPTNEVHIIQLKGKTVPYGKDMPAGNVYYLWPGWLPVIGLSRTIFPVSIFDLNFSDYEAYDKDRVPFKVDITAFFRINEPNDAAQRVADFDELKEQLLYIVKGAVRTVLASEEIDKIMLERSTFGEKFTAEVEPQLKQWGVESVKNIELMDIRDSNKSQVIENIMAKRISFIEKESRIKVAENHKEAEEAEIQAERQVDLAKQEALQTVGQRTAEKDRAVGVANEQAKQLIREQERETAIKDAAVLQVQQVRTAEIEREVKVVQAEQMKQTSIIQAEGDKQETIIVAEGELEKTRREAEGIKAQGEAKAQAERLMQEAPVHAQTMLAKEIGTNQGYQQYLLGLEQIAAIKVVGEAQAEALVKADVKIISTGGTPQEGLNSLLDLFSARGGQMLGSMLEGFTNTPAGEKLTKQ